MDKEDKTTVEDLRTAAHERLRKLVKVSHMPSSLEAVKIILGPGGADENLREVAHQELLRLVNATHMPTSLEATRYILEEMREE